MKKLFVLLLCIAVFFTFAGCGDASPAQSDAMLSDAQAVSSESVSSVDETDTRIPVKILPIGDAMTEGCRHNACGGYRVPLLKLLDEDKVPYEFVGLYDTGSVNVTNGQVMHSGQEGATVFSIEKVLPKMIKLNPDIILLMVGRVESVSGVNGEEFIKYFDKYTVEKILKYFPDATVYVASIPPIREYAGPKSMDENDIAQKLTNPLMKELVESKKANGAKIEWVDMGIDATGLVWEDFTVDDNIYPLPSGNEKLAAVWHDAIKDKISEISAQINQ